MYKIVIINLEKHRYDLVSYISVSLFGIQIMMHCIIQSILIGIFVIYKMHEAPHWKKKKSKTLFKSVYKWKQWNDLLNRNLNEYAVIGKFRDEKFVLIANGVSRNMWFFINDKLVCVFQPDLDDLQIREKDRIMPYILIDGQVTEAELVECSLFASGWNSHLFYVR